jgi:hypothetical protein
MKQKLLRLDEGSQGYYVVGTDIIVAEPNLIDGPFTVEGDFESIRRGIEQKGKYRRDKRRDGPTINSYVIGSSDGDVGEPRRFWPVSFCRIPEEDYKRALELLGGQK